MKISKEGIKLIAQFEGVKLKPYLCPAGVPTIGIGSTYYEDGRKVSMKDPEITLERAYEIFDNTVKIYEQAVLKVIKTHLTQNQFDALTSFCYNVGGLNLAKSTLAKIINSGKYTDEQIIGQFLRWNKAGGKELRGLTKRRMVEANLFNKK